VVEIRELQLSDYPAIAALNERNGLRTAPEAEWRRLWVDNPHAGLLADVSKGWVMQDPQGTIVGAACNVPTMYALGGRKVRSATGMAWAVDQSHRNASLLLLDAFFSQNRVDLLLNTTANSVAGKAWEAFKAERLPHPEYDRNLLWITRYQRFASAATRRLAWRAASLMQIPIAGGLWAQDLLRRLRAIGRVRRNTRPDVERLDAFDDRFDSLWTDLCNQAEPRLRAARDAKSLAWHFGPALQRDEAFILGCPADDGVSLDGYLVARRRDRSDIGLRRYQIADLQVRSDRPHTVPRLVAEAIRVARSEKAAAIELTGFEPAKYQLAAQIPHRVRRLETWPFFYKCRELQLQDQLRNPDVWDPSPFDGDATL
jgi:hypothetical protein